MATATSYKRSLVAAILVLCICFTSFIGATLAWFTDSVSSDGNRIVSGTLEVDLEMHDKVSGEWVSLKNDKTPIFNYLNWEPGYTETKLLQTGRTVATPGIRKGIQQVSKALLRLPRQYKD